MTCKPTFDAGIQQRDNAVGALNAAIATLTVSAMPLVPTIGAMTPLGMALTEVQSAKANVAIALVDFQQAMLCYATNGDGPNANKTAGNQSEAIKALNAIGGAESAIQAAMAACIFLFPTAAISVTTAAAEAGKAVGFCNNIAK